MKTKLLFTSSCGVALTIVSLLALNGCGKSSSSGNSAPGVNMIATAKTSAEPTSFNNVAAKLDSGGSLYLYLSTEQWLAKLSEGVDKVHGIFDSIPQGSAEDHDRIGKVFDVVSRLVQDSGIEDVSGFGMSSIATETGFYHTKTILHHYKGRGNGFLWTMFGSSPHELDGLNMLPATTAMAMFSDLDVSQLWSEIQNQVKQLDMPEVSRGMDQFAAQFQRRVGMDWNKTLASLGGEYGLVITLDDSKMIPIPLGNERLEVPTPGIIIVAKMKDDTIFDRVELAMNQAGLQVVKVDEGGLKMRTAVVPLPIPIEVRPTVAMADGYMFIASNDSLVREMLAVKSGKSSSLKSTDEFKKLSADVPLQGNGFSYVSQRFGKTIVQAQTQVMSMQGGGNGAAPMKMLQDLMNPGGPAHSFGVSANTDEGWMSVGNGNQNPANVILLVPVAITAMGAAMVLPAVASAKTKAQQINCINNLKQINLAKEMWALDKNKKTGDAVSWNDLRPYLDRTLTCPQAGIYELNPIGINPTCSIPGHVLP